MFEIKEIYKVHFMSNRVAYVGTLRNSKRFNIEDQVFFVYKGNNIARGKIVGVELPPTDNPEYTYKITIPEDILYDSMNRDDFHKGIGLDTVTLTCDEIFNTIEEAKQSAKENLERMYKLQGEEIERYFKQFENQ